MEEITTLANIVAFFLQFHASASYARRTLLCFHCFPMSVPLSRYPHPSPLDSTGGLLGLEQSLHKVQGHWARQRREIDSSHRLFWLVSVGIS